MITSGIKNFAAGFGAAAVLLGAALIGTISYYSGRIVDLCRERNIAVIERTSHFEEKIKEIEHEKSGLEEKLKTAERMSSAAENHNDRLRDEVVLADVRLKQSHDRQKELEQTVSRLEANSRAVSRAPVRAYTAPIVEVPEPAVNLESLISDFRGIAYDNYKKIQNKQTPLLSRELKSRFISKAKEHGISARTYEELKEYFEKKGKFLHIGNAYAGDVLHGEAILAELVWKKNRDMNVKGRNVAFTSYAWRNPEIRNFIEYNSDGKNFNASFSLIDIVVHNWEISRGMAENTWLHFRGSWTYPDIRKHLVEAEWGDLYRSLLRKHSSAEKAKEEFIAKVADDLILVEDAHESYHIAIRGTKYNTSDMDEEIRSIYHQYVQSPLKRAMLMGEVYRLYNCPETTSETVFREFIDYIRAEQGKGRFANIRISGSTLKEQAKNLHLLTGPEIRQIAGYLLEKRENAIKKIF